MDSTTGDLIIDDDEILAKIFSLPVTKTIHAEMENVIKAVELGKDTGAKLYFCHITSQEELSYLAQNKTKNIFVEVAPHHLFLTLHHLEQLGSFAEMKPSLKSKEHQTALWEGIKNNLVDTIATDHAPHTKDEKMEINYPFGIPGCETMLPLLLNAVNDGLLGLKKVVQLCCENPARIFKINGKGLIEEGFDADLTIVDMNLEKEVSNDELLTKCRWSPFNGYKLKGWPVMTIVNGNVVYDNGNVNTIRGREVQFV